MQQLKPLKIFQDGFEPSFPDDFDMHSQKATDIFNRILLFYDLLYRYTYDLVDNFTLKVILKPEQTSERQVYEIFLGRDEFLEKDLKVIVEAPNFKDLFEFLTAFSIVKP